MDDQIGAKHEPVLLNECLDLLAPAFEAANPVMVDATVGLGGHTEAALRRFPNLTVIGIDRDATALHLASRRLASFGSRFEPFHGTFDQFEDALGGRRANGILMDLGVSSMQLDERERGFSYAHDAPLDMRMDPEGQVIAFDLINNSTEVELVRILRKFGEERFAPRIAKAIIRVRANAPIETTGELVEIVRNAIPAAARRTGGNPAKRTFQAIRIAVNEELDILEAALPEVLSNLTVGGRLVVESYQSLEDRIVKKFFAAGAASHLPPDLPIPAASVEEGKRLRLLTRGAMKASQEEIEKNPRSASVRLRAAELLIPWRKDVS